MVETDSQVPRHSVWKSDVQVPSTQSGIEVLIGFIPAQKVERCGTRFNRFSDSMNEQQHAWGKSAEIPVVTRTVKRDDAAVVEAINGGNISFLYG